MKSKPYFFGGYESNPLVGEFHVCYWIELPDGRLYVGAKSGLGCDHTVGSKYFTSSTDKDFVNKFKNGPSNFVITVRYFMSKEEACKEEYSILSENNVRCNTLFVNKIAVPSNTCGIGTVAVHGERVQAHDFYANKLEHPSKGLENVYLKDTGEMIKIKREEFNPTIHRKELEGMVHCFDRNKGCNVRVSKEEFDNNKDRYCGVTKGLVLCWDTQEKRLAQVEKDSFDGVRYVGTTHRKSPFKKDMSGLNQGFVVVYDLNDRRFTRISKALYASSKGRYLNSSTKGVYYINGKFFSNKSKIPVNIREEAVFVSKEELSGKHLEIVKYEN